MNLETKVERCLLMLIDNFPLERIAKRKGFSREQIKGDIVKGKLNLELSERWVVYRLLITAALLVLTKIFNPTWLAYFIMLYGFYVLVEILIHVLNTLLFNRPHSPPRLVILLFINYLEIVVLFAALYSSMPDVFHGAGYWLHSLQASFGYMTSFQKAYLKPLLLSGLVITLLQTLIGWFFNVVIISGFIGLLMGEKK